MAKANPTKKHTERDGQPSISFDLPEGVTVGKLNVRVTQELIDLARSRGWSGCEMYAEAVSRALPPEAYNIVVRLNDKVGRRRSRMNDSGDSLQ
jgi:hypothetical protein